MIYLLWLLSLLIAFALGYKLGDITKKLRAIKELLKEKADKVQPEPEKPVSEVIDPYDEIQTAIYERDKLIKKLNP